MVASGGVGSPAGIRTHLAAMKWALIGSRSSPQEAANYPTSLYLLLLGQGGGGGGGNKETLWGSW